MKNTVNNMITKAVLFDLDGVLVDTAHYHFLAWQRLADTLGFHFTEEHNERFKGVSRMACMDILLELAGMDATDDEKLRWATRKNDWYVDMLATLDESALLPGAKDFLESLKARGVRIALGSASKNARVILEKTGIAPYFHAVVDGHMTAKAKPDPEVFLLGAALLGAEPAECVVFEDAAAGVEAAIAGGMKVVGIGSPAVLGRAHVVVPGFAGLV